MQDNHTALQLPLRRDGDNYSIYASFQLSWITWRRNKSEKLLRITWARYFVSADENQKQISINSQKNKLAKSITRNQKKEDSKAVEVTRITQTRNNKWQITRPYADDHNNDVDNYINSNNNDNIGLEDRMSFHRRVRLCHMHLWVWAGGYSMITNFSP